MSNDVAGPDGSGLSEGLGPLPWGDIEAWLEVSDASQIASDIRAYADAEVARAVAAERERWCGLLVELCWASDQLFQEADETRQEYARFDAAHTAAMKALGA